MSEELRPLPPGFVPPTERDCDSPMAPIRLSSVESAYHKMVEMNGPLPQAFQDAYEKALREEDLYTAVIVLDRWDFVHIDPSYRVSELEDRRELYESSISKRGRRPYISPDDVSDLLFVRPD